MMETRLPGAVCMATVFPRACGYLTRALFILWIPAMSVAQSIQTVPSAPGSDDIWIAAVETSVADLPKFAAKKVTVTFTDKLPKWPVCTRPRAIPGVGSASTGKFSVNLRCESPRWSGQVVVQVEAPKRYLVASRTLQSGVIVSESDLNEVETDWTKVADDVMTEPDQLLGKTLLRSIQQGQAFTLNSVRLTTVIKMGDRVRVQMAGSNFVVTGDAIATQAGAVGDQIRVKMASGQFVSASVLKAGTVELRLD
ncbi:MAG: flagella basal body P-ring formation protein FlgA [Betaproteobacteria bacterium]|nr:flagella basal body P-ring formation protein FlgA [Betaproteobacteria bacterium]